MTDIATVVAADVGGTSTRLGVVDADGTILSLTTTSTPAGPDSIIRHLTGCIHEAIDGFDRVGFAAPSGIGIGIPGRLGNDGGEWSMALNLGVTTAVDLRGALTDRLHLPVSLGNDVLLATRGAAHDCGPEVDLAYVSLGTGIAAGIVSQQPDGLKRRAAWAGELGHVPVPGATIRCICGQLGCAESVASGSGLQRRWVGSGRAPFDDVSELWDHADAADPTATLIRTGCIAALAWMVQLYTMSFGVTSVVFGGGLTKLGERLAEPLASRLRRNATMSDLVASYRLDEHFELADPDAQFGILGAADLAFQNGVTR